MRRHMMFLMLLICFALLCACGGNPGSDPAVSVAESASVAEETITQEPEEVSAEAIEEESSGNTQEEPEPTPPEVPEVEPEEAEVPDVESEEPTPEEVPEESPEETAQPDFDAFDYAVSQLVAPTYGENYRISHGEGIDGSLVYIVDVWETGGVLNAMFAVTNGGEYLDKWNETVAFLTDVCTAIGNTKSECGLDEYAVTVQYLNESTMNNALLMITDGEVVQNFVQNKLDEE